MSTPKGWPTQEKDQRLVPQFATVEPVHTLQHGLSVLAHQYVAEIGTDAAEAGSSEIAIVATAHLAQAGDVVRLTSGALSGREIKVYQTAIDLITLAEELPSAIAAGVTFQILRHKYPLVESTGEIKVSGSFTATEEAVAADGGALPAKVKVAGGYDGSAVQVLKTDSNGELQVDVLSSALPSGAATSTAQTDGTQKSQIVDAAGDIADVKLLSVNLAGSDKGLVTNTIIHGETTGGGGGYVDVKVTPSGALTVESTLAGLDAAVIGQETMANSLPVVIASNQSAIPAKMQDGTGNALTSSGGALWIYGNGGNMGAYLYDGNANKIFSTSNALNVHVASGTVTTTNSANGNTGSAVPSQATQIGGTDGTNLRGIKTDANGELQIDVLSSALPTGAATDAQLVSLNNKIPANITVSGSRLLVDNSGVTQPVSGSVSISGSVAVTGPLTDAQLRATAVPVSAASLPLPTGAATESTLSSLNSKVTACDTGSVTIASSALPSGAATETTLAALNTKMPSQGQALMVASVPVVIASNQTAIPVSGSFTAGKLSVVDLLDANILDTSSTNIPGSSSSPVQVIASTAAEIKAIQLLDTTGAFVGVYVGGVGVEVLKFVMGPGSDQTIEHNIPAASRVSLKRLDSTAAVSSGIVAFNCMG